MVSYPQYSKHLVITEVNINAKNQEIWIEIYNPENISLVLNSIRISGVKTPNALPPKYRKLKGIVIQPGERIIVCSDEQKFMNIFNCNCRIVELKLLQNVIEGGFIAINNLDNVETNEQVIRIGDKEMSKSIADLVPDNEVLTSTYDNMSYSRKLKNTGEISLWYKTIPTPGK